MHLDCVLHPLHIAVFTKNHSGLGLLIDHYFRDNGRNENISTSQGGFDDQHRHVGPKLTCSVLDRPLCLAKNSTSIGLPSVLKSLAIRYDGPTPLHIAACLGDEESVKILLDRGAQVDSLTNPLITPLHCAVDAGQILVAKLLLQRGANPQRRDRANQTAGMLAAYYGNTKFLLELEKYGLDFLVRDIYGRSYLYLALQSRQPQLLAFCTGKSLEASPQSTENIMGFDSAWRTDTPTFVLDYLPNIKDATHLEYLGFVALLRKKQLPLLRKVLRRLGIEHKAITSINSRGKLNPRTPLWLASTSGLVESVQILMKAGAVVDVDLPAEDNPLAAACEAGRLEVVEFLLRHASMQAGAHAMGSKLNLIDASKHFPEIRQWLLVHRWTEQLRLAETACSPELDWIRPWAGLDRRAIPLTDQYARFGCESMLDYAVRLRAVREDFLGKILCWDSGSAHPFVVGSRVLNIN